MSTTNPMNKEIKEKCPCCSGKGFRVIVNPEWLRDKRKSKGLSLRAVARALKVSAAYISDVELGKRNCTSFIKDFYKLLK